MEAPPTDLPSECDYLIAGGGATALAFADTLLAHYSHSSNRQNNDDKDAPPQPPPSIVIVDPHSHPGGQWNDSYGFVRLHQPSAMYGVETMKLEEGDSKTHRATRQEILSYYQNVVDTLAKRYGLRYIGGATVNLSSSPAAAETDSKGEGGSGREYTTVEVNADSGRHKIRVKKRLVDARYLQPDLPIDTPPTFNYDPERVKCIPVNDLTSSGTTAAANVVDGSISKKHYVVIGGGKTGMDALVHLQTQMNVSPEDILWITPHKMWITARESIGSCLEFLHDCALLAKDKSKSSESNGSDTLEDALRSRSFFQDGFVDWEKRGHVYRLDDDNAGSLPTKFKDATLDRDEMNIIRRVTNVSHGRGRVREIRSEDGALIYADGTAEMLPWPQLSPENTTYVHCSAGAFNYTKQSGPTPPVFAPGKIVIQDVYGTPGFCFVGSVVGKLEATDALTDDERNVMCLAPKLDPDVTAAKDSLGPSGGDVGVLSSDHGLVQRLSNLRRWRTVPGLREWFCGHRLFNLGEMTDAEVGIIVDETWDVLEEGGVVVGE